MVHTARAQDPVSFGWRPAGDDGRRHFDLLVGTSDDRLTLERDTNPDDIVASWRSELDSFMERRKHFQLYPA